MTTFHSELRACRCGDPDCWLCETEDLADPGAPETNRTEEYWKKRFERIAAGHKRQLEKQRRSFEGRIELLDKTRSLLATISAEHERQLEEQRRSFEGRIELLNKTRGLLAKVSAERDLLTIELKRTREAAQAELAEAARIRAQTERMQRHIAEKEAEMQQQALRRLVSICPKWPGCA